MLSGLSACASNFAAVDSYCAIYEPIFWSEQDTQDTRDQIDRENGKYVCICNKDCPDE